jgi:phenylacetate-CoA ligase
MLSPEIKQLIEKEFGCLVYSTFQTTETGSIGFQCERREGFHLNMDLCAVRLVDAHGQDVPPGETGELVVSNLHNKAMVLLNYKMDDLGSFENRPCPCGRSLPVLNLLEGRRSDLLELPGNRSISALTIEGFCRHELKPTVQAQIQQLSQNEICWRLVPYAQTDLNDLRNRLIERTRLMVSEEVRVTVEFVSDIPRTPQGKFRRVLKNNQ